MMTNTRQDNTGGEGAQSFYSCSTRRNPLTTSNILVPKTEITMAMAITLSRQLKYTVFRFIITSTEKKQCKHVVNCLFFSSIVSMTP